MNFNLTEDEWQILAAIAAENGAPSGNNSATVNWSRRLVDLGLVAIVDNEKRITTAGVAALAKSKTP